MRTRTPPYRESNHRHPVLMSSPELVLQVLPPIPLESKTPSLRRAASFPDLHKIPPSNERHVSFHADAPECYNPSLARSVSMNQSQIPPPIQRRWPHTPFSKRKSTHGESVPCSRTSSQGESNTAVSNSSSPMSRSPCVRDLPLNGLDEHCECHNGVGCDEHGMMNRPQLYSLSEGTASTRSSFTMSLRLPSVRKAFSGKRRPASVPPRTPTVINVNTNNQSPKQTPTPESTGKRSPSPPTLSISSEMYRVEYVNPFRMKKPKIKPSACHPTISAE